MKKIYFILALCFASVAGLSQSQEKTPSRSEKEMREENSAKADKLLIDKKAVTKDTKRKKPRRDKHNKECSRMKS